MATTLLLQGRLADITSRPIAKLTKLTVKAPTYRPGPGVELTTSAPVEVSVRNNGEFTINVVEGVGWLYLEGAGWSESIRFVASTGMKTVWEAVVNAMPLTLDTRRLLMELGRSYEYARRDLVEIVESRLGDATRAAEAVSSEVTTLVEALREAYAASEAGSVLPPYLTQSALDARYAARDAKTKPLVGAGIDPTGVEDSTAGVQAAFDKLGDGEVLTLPAGSVFKLTRGIRVAAANVVVQGPGTFRWVDGIENGYGFEVVANGVTFSSVTLENPNRLGAKVFTGVKNTGIYFKANNGQVLGCTVDKFHNGVAVDPGDDRAEYGGFRIIGNRIRDVVGVGGGATGEETQDQSARAEASGDGITVWGSSAVIVGNIVNAERGTDARVGIHVESLGNNPPASPDAPYPDSMATITGNIVWGQFRRGITDELVNECSITGNIVADSTWWGINATNGAKNMTVSGNTVLWTATAQDLQGEKWAPRRGPLGITGPSTNVVVSGNVVRCVPGSVAKAFLFLGEFDHIGTGAANFSIVNNIMHAEDGAVVDNSVSVAEIAFENIRVSGNTFTGHSGALYCPSTKTTGALVFCENIIRAKQKEGSPVVQFASVKSPGLIFSNNLVTTGRTDNTVVEIVNSEACVITGNSIHGGAIGIELYGTSQSIVTGNLIKSSTDVANAGSNTVSGNAQIA